jgi:hypothetical protein
MTCRGEILVVVDDLERRGLVPFSPDDVIREMRRRGSTYRDSTIRTHVVSRMCANAPGHHGTVYDDLNRVGPGLYRKASGSYSSQEGTDTST